MHFFNIVQSELVAVLEEQREDVEADTLAITILDNDENT